MSSQPLKGVCVGAGYFAQFHYEAWGRIPEVHLAAACDLDESKARAIQQQHGLPAIYSDVATMLERERPDFIDIITPPATHRPLCELAASRGVSIICQKPMAPTLAEARAMVEVAREHGVRFMVHENFRFQPWHREIRRLVDDGAIGDRLHSLYFRSRQGDGWGEDAYLARQPYFREMRRFLVFELGVHFIDTFRYLGGEVRRVFAKTRRLNPAIQGEDACLLLFDFETGAEGLWDANRFNESIYPDPRYTFGDFLVEGSGGSIRLYGDSRLTVQRLGDGEREHDYSREHRNFCGDCVYWTQRHFVERLTDGQPFETGGAAYLRNLDVQEALYDSAERRAAVDVLP